MKKKTEKNRELQLWAICVILERKRVEICVKMHFSRVYKRLEYVDLRERNRKWML